MARVLGADVAAGSWVGIVLDDDPDDPGSGAPIAVSAVTAPDVGSLLEAAGAVAVVALDIPVGLAETGARRADAAARALVGRRASSVFPTPVRAALTAADHAEAVRVSREVAGTGVSAQAYALRHKILEVDRWWRAARSDGPGASGPSRVPRLVEAHPEACFAVMAGHPLAHRKKSWAGAAERRALLRSVGVDLPDDLGDAGRAGAVDDVLDAAAVAWTARRVAHGLAVSHPHPPEPTPDGWLAAIWT